MDIYSTFVGITGPLLSSFASAIRSNLRRVHSFTGGSFNDRTSLIGSASVRVQPSAVSSPSQTHEAARVTIEVLGVVSPPPASDAGDADAESKRVSKSAVTVSVFVASASVAMLVSYPRPSDASDDAAAPALHNALYSVDVASICMSLFASLALLMHSVIAARSRRPEVTRVQKAAMVVSLASVLVSFTLRAGAMLPASSSPTLAWLFFLLGAPAAATAVFLYLLLTWKGDGAGGLVNGASAADQV